MKLRMALYPQCAWFYDEVDDVLAASEYLAGLPYVDPARLYVAGHSSGGTLTMLAAMTTDRFRAAAALDGSPDRRSFIEGREDDVPFEMTRPEEFRMRSPLAFATSFRCPIRFFCSNESVGYIKETERLVKAAKQSRPDVEMVLVTGDHNTFRAPAAQLAIRFFQKR